MDMRETLLAGVLFSFCFLVAVSVVLAARNRSLLTWKRIDQSSLREELAILQAEVAQLREEIEQVKRGQGKIRSTHIQEG